MSSQTVGRFVSPKVEQSLQLVASVFALANYLAWMAGVASFESAVMSIALMACVIAAR